MALEKLPGSLSTSHARLHAGHGEAPGFPLGQARASFVAHLHRKVAELQERRVDFVDSQDSALRVRARSFLIAELEMLAQGSDSMRIEAMAAAVQEALAIVRRAPKYAKPNHEEGERLNTLLASLPTLAYRAGEPLRVAKPTRIALLVGMAKAEMTTAQRVLSLPQEDGNAYECTVVTSVGEACTRAAEILPDVILVDADSIDALTLLGKLEETVSEILPVVVMGSHDEATHKEWQASGATRTLSKPFTPRQLRSQVDNLFGGERPKLRGALGSPTLGALRRLLADELALAMAPLGGNDDTAIPLGEGSEVLGALWGAASRIREVITARTGGAVQFSAEGPHGTIALAPSLDLATAAGRREQGQRKAAPAFSLQDLDVVVADDDPAVVWFLADALRQAGATVHEAHDGKQALALAERIQPDLLVTDILMPELDGLALSRRVHAHPLLAGTPILLLSWKEDLLTKVRELGANAAGYLCKESDRGVVVFHAREALAPRVRLRNRLKDGLREHGCDVHGRFDALTPYGLLRVLQKLGVVARVMVRDAAAHFEVTVAGDDVWAVKTTNGGMLVRGEGALTSLLGMRAGRFAVAQVARPTDVDAFVGALDAVAHRYAAQVVRVSDAVEANRGNAVRYRFDRPLLAEYMKTVPTHVAHGLAALDVGASLGQVRSGELAPWLPETLHDLAARGALVDVEHNGVSTLRSAPEPVIGEARAKVVEELVSSAEPRNAEPAAEIVAQAVEEQPAAEVLAAEPPTEALDEALVVVAKPLTIGDLELTDPPPTFAEPEIDAPEISQISAAVQPVNPSLELSPSPVSWSVEQALGESDTSVDDVLYEDHAQALQDEIRVCTAPDPTLYGGRDKVAANSVIVAAEPISVKVQPIEAEPQAKPRMPSLLERAEARAASIAPSSNDVDVAHLPDAKKTKPKNKRSLFPVALFGAATGGAILLASLLSPEGNGKAAGGHAPSAPALGDMPAGILEVDANGQTVLVDGVPRGRGQRVSVVLSQGPHAVGLEGHSETRQVEVRASEVVRVNLEKLP